MKKFLVLIGILLFLFCGFIVYDTYLGVMIPVLDIEENIILEAEFKNSVIATGGSAVFGEKAMKKLKENGVVIYLSLPMDEIKKRIGDIKSRGVVLTNGTTVDDIFAERKPLYEKYADIKIDCDNLTAEECVEKIIADLQSL